MAEMTALQTAMRRLDATAREGAPDYHRNGAAPEAQLTASMDDALNVVSRHRWRQGQRLVGDDGQAVRDIWRILRELPERAPD